MLDIIKINENTWRIEEGKVRFFLLAGTKEAILIDSGMQINNAKEIAMELTKLPVKLINTHADMDHIGSNEEFSTFYMHPSETANFYHNLKYDGDFIPVEDGDVIDLGDRPLEIIHVPGHTPGSIAILDRNMRVLFSGDSIQDGVIYMFGPHREIHAYQKSLEKIKKYTPLFDEIYPSHGSLPITADMIEGLHQAVENILTGKMNATNVEVNGNTVEKYDVGIATFLMEQEQVSWADMKFEIKF